MAKNRRRKKKGANKPKSQPMVTPISLADRAMVAAEMRRTSAFDPFTTPLDSSIGANAARMLASDQVVHLTEAAKDLATALCSALKANGSQAVHMAYYSEIRSAMSLFSGSGIRIRKKDYFYVDSTGNRTPFPAPNSSTHPAIFDTWSEWIKRIDAKSILMDGVKLYSAMSLRDLSSSTATIGIGVESIGYDFNLLRDDRDARNEASYLTLQAQNPLERNSTELMRLVTDICEMFLPGNDSLTIDGAIFTYWFMHAADQRASAASQSDQSIFSAVSGIAHLNQVSEDISRNTGESSARILQMMRPLSRYCRIISLAYQKSSRIENILSRAAILLRLAMLSLKENLGSPANEPTKAWIYALLSSAGVNADPSYDGYVISQDYCDAMAAIRSTGGALDASDLWSASNAYNTNLCCQIDASICWGVFD